MTPIDEVGGVRNIGRVRSEVAGTASEELCWSQWQGKAILSRHLQRVTCGGQTLLYNSLFGKGLVCGSGVQDLIGFFDKERDLTESAAYCGVTRDEVARTLLPFFARSLLVPTGTDERLPLFVAQDQLAQRLRRDERFSSVVLVTTSACNFACAHCVSQVTLAGARRHHNRDMQMSLGMARGIIDLVLRRARLLGRATFDIGFGGGEPLLNWETILGTMRYVTEEYPGMRADFAFNSNVSLVTDGIARALRRYRVNIVPSIDGMQAANDAVRVDRRGCGTFGDIVRGLTRLRENGVGIRAVSTTIVDGNFDLLDGSFLDWLAELGCTTVRIEPDIVGELNRPVPQIVDKLLYLRNEGQQRGIIVQGRWLRPFLRMTDPEANGASALTFCSALGGGGFAVDASGFVRICGYLREPVCCIADWDRVRTSEGHIGLLRKHWIPGISACLSCSLEGICKGGCLVSRENRGSAGPAGPFWGSGASNPTAHHAEPRNPSPLGFTCGVFREVTKRLLLEVLDTQGQKDGAPKEHARTV